MDILDRYLQAVKFWLPSSQQEDIAAELGDDLRSQIEERESALGRKLNEGEVEDLLQRRGRPLLVAQNYLPQRDLIGRALLPAYWFVLKLSLFCYLVPWVAVWFAMVSLNPQYRARHLGIETVTDLYVLVANAVAVFAVVTIVFAILERVKETAGLFTKWNPRTLPPVRNFDRIPRSASGFEIVMSTVFGIWWLKILWGLTVFVSSGIDVRLSPEWHPFFWAFLPLTIANPLLSSVNFARPYWTRTRRGLRAAFNLVSAAVIFLLAKSVPAVYVNGTAVVGDDPAAVSGIVSVMVVLAFTIAGLVCLIVGVVDLWRALSRRQPMQLERRQAV